jgi:hypothetical protein
MQARSLRNDTARVLMSAMGGKRTLRAVACEDAETEGLVCGPTRSPEQNCEDPDHRLNVTHSRLCPQRVESGL